MIADSYFGGWEGRLGFSEEFRCRLGSIVFFFFFFFQIAQFKSNHSSTLPSKMFTVHVCNWMV